MANNYKLTRFLLRISGILIVPILLTNSVYAFSANSIYKGEISFALPWVKAGKCPGIISPDPELDYDALVETINYGKKGIKNQYRDGKWELRESGRNIETFNAIGTSKTHTRSVYTNKDIYWKVSDMSGALQLHWAMEQVYDYFLNAFGRKGADNNGMKINCHWLGNFTPDDGSISKMPVNTIISGISNCKIQDIGYQYTKKILLAEGITSDYLEKLDKAEIGALAEGFASIFACVSAIKITGSINTSSWKSPLFDLKDPTNCPVQYKGPNWRNDDFRYNGSVLGHWFYLLSEGVNGVTGVGIDKAAMIAYRVMAVYLKPDSDYQQCCAMSLLACKELFNTSDNEYNQCLAAWKAVGMAKSIKTNITPYNANQNPVVAKPEPLPAQFIGLPATVSFKNLSENADKFEWNFGDGTPIETHPSPMHTYTSPGTYQVTLKVTNTMHNISKIGNATVVVKDKLLIPKPEYIFSDQANKEMELEKNTDYLPRIIQIKNNLGEWIGSKSKSELVTIMSNYAHRASLIDEVLREGSCMRFVKFSKDYKTGEVVGVVPYKYYGNLVLNILPSENNSNCSGSELSFTASVKNIRPPQQIDGYKWFVNGVQVISNTQTYSSTILKYGDVLKCVVALSNDPNNRTSIQAELLLDNIMQVPVPVLRSFYNTDKPYLEIIGIEPRSGIAFLDADLNQYLIVPGNNEILSQFTIEALIKPTNSFKNGVYFSLLSSNNKLLLYQQNNKVMRLQINSKYYSFPCAPSLNEWSHLALTYSGNTLYMYLNGSKQAVITLPQQFSLSCETIHLGGNPANNPAKTFSGSIDEFRLWNVALTANEIFNLMYKGITTEHSNYSNLVRYLKFNDSEGLKDEVSGDLVITPNGYKHSLESDYWREDWDAIDMGGFILGCKEYEVKVISPSGCESPWSERCQFTPYRNTYLCPNTCAFGAGGTQP